MKAKQIITVMVPVILLVLGLVFWFIHDESAAPSVPDRNDKMAPVRPEMVTVSGEVICLPHKDPSDTQTLECALGLKDEQGRNYALSTSTPSQISSLPVGSKVTVVAVSKPPAAKTNYDVVGSLQVESVTKQ